MREALKRASERPPVITEKKTKKKSKEQEKTEEFGKAATEGLKKGLTNGGLTRSSLDTDPYEQAKRDYHRISTEKNASVAKDEPDEPDTEDEDRAEETDDAGKTEQDMLDLTRIDRTQPYIINDREYSEEFDHHNKVSLYYYRVDDVLCEENEEIIDDVDAAIGNEALSILDTQTTVWVRNEPLAIDYEIIALNSSFAESAHGIHIKPLKPGAAMTPRERYIEKQNKRRENSGE